MGSPLSPVISNLYMEYFESCLLPNIKPPGMLWLRYVDDIFCNWNINFGNFDQFIANLNTLAPSIKFTSKWEIENRIPFLDVLVRFSESNYPEFAVYRKPTHCATYIHFFSSHHHSVKMNIVSSMFSRALRTCNKISDLNHEFDIINSQFSRIGCPPWFLKKSSPQS